MTICQGELEPDYDGPSYGDTVDACGPNPDEEGLKRDFPKIFKYECCDALGDDTSGCKKSPHRERRRDW